MQTKPVIHPLILLPGALGTARQMDDLQTQSNQWNPQVFGYTYPGHGDRQKIADPFSIHLFSSDLLRFLDEQQLATVNLFGYSMGGYVALDFALHWPDRVGRIVTLGTKFDWTPATATQASLQLNPEQMLTEVPQFAEMLAARHPEANWKIVAQKTADLLLGLGNGMALTHQQLATIAHPILVLLGDQDKMVSQEESIAAASALIHGRFETVPATKHPFERVDITMLQGYIRAFLEQSDDDAAFKS